MAGRPRVLSGVLIAALAVGSSACGSDSSGSKPAEESSAEEYKSPLADYLGVSYDGFDEESLDAQQAAINESVTACMAEQGFEWVPNANDSIISTEVGEDGLEYGSEEWVKKYGFGITTQAFPQKAVGPDLIGSDDSFFAPVDESADPNSAYVESLSPADQEAYSAALYGDEQEPTIDPETMTEEEINAALDDYSASYEPSGCLNLAYEDSSGPMSAVYQKLGPELEAMYEAAAKDPRILAEEQKVATCVADSGLTYTSMDKVYENFDSRLGPLQEQYWSTLSQADTGTETEAGTEVGTDGGDEAPIDPEIVELSDADKATLAELQTEELKLAAAVYECGGSDMGFSEVSAEVYAEYEQRFLDENRAAIDAIKNESSTSSTAADGGDGDS